MIVIATLNAFTIFSGLDKTTTHVALCEICYSFDLIVDVIGLSLLSVCVTVCVCLHIFNLVCVLLFHMGRVA